MRADYHCHTRWCNHGIGEIEDYIKVAIENGLLEIAITEHVPHIDNIDKRRLAWKDFENYNNELDKMILKYKDKIKVIKGFECEYYPEYIKTYKKFRDEYNYQIMILGHHTNSKRTKDNFSKKTQADMLVYGKEVCEALNTGFFTFIAHIDVPLCGYEYGLDEVAIKVFNDIFKVCEKLDIPIEYNANGVREKRNYPNNKVFEISKKYKLRYLVNSDAHSPDNICDQAVKQSIDYLKSKNFNLIEKL